MVVRGIKGKLATSAIKFDQTYFHTLLLKPVKWKIRYIILSIVFSFLGLVSQALILGAH